MAEPLAVFGSFVWGCLLEVPPSESRSDFQQLVAEALKDVGDGSLRGAANDLAADVHHRLPGAQNPQTPRLHKL